MDNFIDLRSDTVTKPTKEMQQAMLTARVGDDVYGEDPTVIALEEKLAKMFGMEAGLFCPSGTMTNQIAIKAHTQPLDEVICDKLSHIYQYEVGGYAFNSQISIKLLDGENGIINADQVKAAIQPEQDWLPNSKLVVIENTTNKGGGSYYSLDQIKAIAKVCQEENLIFHLDGARIFNAVIEADYTPKDLGAEFDSISICLSKGLGAPVGSVLLGTAAMIKKSRKIRKVLGGGMRQAGILAAAAIYALDHHVDRLKEDHQKAQRLSEVLQKQSYVASVIPVKTNIIIFDLNSPYDASSFLEKLAEHHIKASPFGPNTIRLVTHLDFTDKMLEKTVEVLEGID